MDDASPPQSKVEWWPIGLVIATIAGFLLYGIWEKSGLRADLALCDRAIMADLKAPSTYVRIKFPEYYNERIFTYSMSYDAQNSFGVPIRGKGICTVSKDRKSAVWYSLTD